VEAEAEGGTEAETETDLVADLVPGLRDFPPNPNSEVSKVFPVQYSEAETEIEELTE
jgi:hypothetical protein